MMLLIFFIIILLGIGYFEGMYVVPENMAFIIERMGAYQKIASAGRHFKIPFIDRVANKIELSEQILSICKQPILTWDNQTLYFESYIAYKIIKPQLYTDGVANPLSTLETLAITTLRNIIGDTRTVDLAQRHEEIIAQTRNILKNKCDTWGIEILDMDYKFVEKDLGAPFVATKNEQLA